MKQPEFYRAGFLRAGFLRGVIIAAALALTGAVGYAGLSSILGGGSALQLITVLLGGCYVLYLLHTARDRSGRIATFGAWLLVSSSVWLADPGLGLVLITQAVLISLTRALYHHSSVLAGLLDLCLSAFALSAAVWASNESGSVFLTIWCFFLVQALFVGIPSDFRQARPNDTPDHFDRASRTAEAAIRRIATERR